MRIARSSRYPCWLLILPTVPPPATMAWSPRTFWRHQATTVTFSTTACHLCPAQKHIPSHADAIVAAAIAAVDPAAAVRRHLSCQEGQLLCRGNEREASDTSFPIPEHVVVVAFGKASTAMAAAVIECISSDEHSSTPSIAGCVIDKDGAVPSPAESAILSQHPNVTLHTAAHPIPDARNIQASKELMNIIDKAPPSALVVACISGGGSALLCSPLVSLSDLQTTHTLLVESGLSIHEMNRIRRRLETTKGGGLRDTVDLALVLSDVTGDPLEIIASGPTVGNLPAEGPIESRVLERLQPSDNGAQGLPSTVAKLLSQPMPAVNKQSCVNCLVGNTAAAVHAASVEAEKLGYHPVILSTDWEGEASTVGRTLASMALQQQTSSSSYRMRRQLPVALIAGGETTVTLPSDHGLGGRNQEVALSAALCLRGNKGIVVASVGTDGTDGPTDAAGGIVDGSSIGNDADLEVAQTALDYHDAYNFLATARRSDGKPALKKTGPTGTNVADVMVALIADESESG